MNDNLKRKLIMFAVGYCLYITIEVTWRCYSFPLMGLVGGCIMLILDAINNKISWDVELPVYGLVGSAAATGFELVIGLASKFLGLKQMWDYSTMPLNYMGVICAPFSLIWFFLCILGTFLADAINYYVFEEEPVPYYRLFGKKIIQFREKHCKLSA